MIAYEIQMRYLIQDKSSARQFFLSEKKVDSD